PADALRHAALQLALDIAGVNGSPDVLHRGVTDHAHDAELGVDLDVADVRAKAALRALGVELHAGADRAAHRRRLVGELGERQRLELSAIRAPRRGRAVLPLHRPRLDAPS